MWSFVDCSVWGATSPDFQFTALQFMVLVGTLAAMVISLVWGLLRMGARFQYLVTAQAEGKKVTATIVRDLGEINKSLQNTRSRVINMDKDRRQDKKVVEAMQQDISGIIKEASACQKDVLKMFESINRTMTEVASKVDTHLEIHKDRESR